MFFQAIFPQYAYYPINLVCICKDWVNTKLDVGDTDSEPILILLISKNTLRQR